MLILSRTGIVTRHCCICGEQEKTTPYCRRDNYQYVKCLVCGLVFLPDKNKVQDDFYLECTDVLKQERSRTKHSIEYWSVPSLYKKYNKVFEHFFDQRLKQLHKAGYENGPFLDVGCGYGFFVDFLNRKEGIHARGIDIAEEQIEWGKSNLGVSLTVSAAEDYNADEPFSAILLADVLEHLESPHLILSKLNTLLAPGGLLAIQVPNLLGVKLPSGHTWGVPHHIWQFSRGSLTKLLELSGFRFKSYSTGVLGVIGMYERGGPTLKEKLCIKFARKFRTGNRLLLIAEKL
jgi:2-polyprenyl-3-methyl-5-hydroxy-6-metoxy-1,4-benzoquinol methylase